MGYSDRARGLAYICTVVVIWVVAGELIQAIEDGMGAFAVTYLSALVCAAYLPVALLCRTLYSRVGWRGHVWVGRGCGSRCGGSAEPDGDQSESTRLVGPEPDEEPAGETSAPDALLFSRLSKIGLVLGPFWFIANYTYNASLGLTSVASSTVLSTTSSAWTIALTVCHSYGAGKQRQRVSAAQVAAVLLNICGMAIVALSDEDHSAVASASKAGAAAAQNTTQTAGPTTPQGIKAELLPLIGDTLALGSAVCYAEYVLRLNGKVSKQDGEHMSTLVALMGLSSVVLLWPLGLGLMLTGVEPWPTLPDWHTTQLLVLSALIGTYATQVLWAQSVLLTSPVVATCGLSLTIPVAMLADTVLGLRVFRWPYMCGAGLVIFAFGILVVFDPGEHDATQESACDAPAELQPCK